MKKILIDHEPWQIRIAITRNEELQNIYFSTYVLQTLERAFFKGTVIKVLPGIQTAFVDIGQEKAGFLHISEIDRELAIQAMSNYVQVDDDEEKEYEKKLRAKRDISKILKEGDPILVQVSKEPMYEKGAKLTTCFTIPGRFLVLMPNIPRIGVSKKIEDREERIRLKNIIKNYLPNGMGVIIRTTSEGRGEKALLKDLTYLVKEWRTIAAAFDKAKPQEKIHEDLDLSLQIVRDHLDDDVEAVITDNKKNQASIYRFVKKIAPEYTQKIKLYDGTPNIFEFYNIEKQIEQGLEQKAFLRSGGSLIIETTEAMTVIDVNTSKFTGKTNLEETIFKTNMEAAEEVVRQLKLRNIGGLIVIDFIDMAIPANRQKLFQFFEKILRERDKFQSVVLKISEFGIVQMTRKRSGKTLIQQLTSRCPTCKGLGFIRSIQAESHTVLRHLKQDLLTKKIEKQIAFVVPPHIFGYITSAEYNAILSLEKSFNCKITLVSESSLGAAEYKIKIK
jgi:ribonuclease G